MRRGYLAVLLTCSVVFACRGSGRPETAHAHEEEGWSVTAWGDHFEIFDEAEPLVAGKPYESHTHVTVLSGFQPLQTGVVRIVLSRGGQRSVFEQAKPKRPGIYGIEVVPPGEGEFDLVYEVESPDARETIAGGRVRVGTAADPGGPVEEPHAAADAISFLKEQQWRTSFATAAATTGSLRESVRAPGRVRPAAGAEIVLTAPIAGRVMPDPWPHVGQVVPAGEPVFQLVPRVEQGRSLAELSAQSSAAEIELSAARSRLSRLERLLQLEAVAESEVLEARARVAVLEARATALKTDLSTARALRSGSFAGERADVTSPGTGRVSEVRATPGQALEAGDVLGRLIRSGAVWLEVALPAGQVARAQAGVAGLVLYPPGGSAPLSFEPDEFRSVALGPEVAAGTGTVPALYELAGPAVLSVGSRVEVDLLLPASMEGIVVPESAIVDDGGVPVVYVQVAGEAFERREVGVRVRQGERATLDGIEQGERVVVLGGGAIRRAALLSSGPVEGHVH